MAVIGHETLIQAAHDGTLMLLMLPNLSKNVFLPICFSCFCVCCLHINVFLGYLEPIGLKNFSDLFPNLPGQYQIIAIFQLHPRPL